MDRLKTVSVSRVDPVKPPLRRMLVDRRRALSAEERTRQSRLIRERLTHIPTVRAARVVVGYAATPFEVDLMPWLAEESRRGVTIGLPRTEGQSMEIRQWREGDSLSVGPFAIREPASAAPALELREIDVVLVPAVGFDRRGHRVGFGLGYYDRFLSTVPAATKVGVAFDVQVVDRIPEEAHDVSVDWLVLPTETVKV